MNAAFNCIIIDDENHAIGLLAESINGLYSNIKIIGTYNTWKDGLEALRNVKADIVFLDISIGGKNGMDMLKIVSVTDSEIIFVTAFSEYALEAFKYSATGYVVKPVGDEALSHAVNKAIERINNRRLARQTNPQQPYLNTKIGIPSGKGISYFGIEDIVYLEAVNNYTKVVTTKEEITSSYNIGKYKSLLEGLNFFQVHRSYIVNLSFVSRYEATGIVIMSNKREVPVSRNSREEFLKLFTSLHGEMD